MRSRISFAGSKKQKPKFDPGVPKFDPGVPQKTKFDPGVPGPESPSLKSSAWSASSHARLLGIRCAALAQSIILRHHRNAPSPQIYDCISTDVSNAAAPGITWTCTPRRPSGGSSRPPSSCASGSVVTSPGCLKGHRVRPGQPFASHPPRGPGAGQGCRPARTPATAEGGVQTDRAATAQVPPTRPKKWYRS
jgi:hypothetical protein